MPVIRTVPQAAQWIDKVGLAMLFPKADVVLPSLWEQVSARREVDWDAEEINFFWWAKDELPGRGLSCVGKHLARAVSCVAPRLLPALVAANGDPADDDPVVEAIRALGPLTGPQLRATTGLEKKEVDRSIASLHHRLVLTNSHLVDEGSTWGTLAHDLAGAEVEAARPASRRGRSPGGSSRRLVLDQARELTAADLAGAFGWRRKEAAAILDELADGRDDPGGFRIWTRR